jgi:hypothetical protein
MKNDKKFPIVEQTCTKFKKVHPSYKVAVHKGSISKDSTCNIKPCINHDVYMIFSWDGVPKLSRLFGTCCQQHLPLVKLKAHKDNVKADKRRQGRSYIFSDKF